jgi:hypothetical protein
MRAIVAGLAVGGGLSAMLADRVEAATVFSDYNGVISSSFFNPSLSPLIYAGGFTPSASYNFSGAAAFVQNDPINSSGQNQPFSLALYSSISAGEPDAVLWASGTLFAPGPAGTATLVTTSYSGPSILLQSGDEYFLAVDLPNDTVDWLDKGSSAVPFYSSNNNGSSWTALSAQTVQFEVYGDRAATGVPEPSTWAALLLAFVSLGCVRYRARRSAFAAA